jgi:hypothetical protein
MFIITENMLNFMIIKILPFISIFEPINSYS